MSYEYQVRWHRPEHREETTAHDGTPLVFTTPAKTRMKVYQREGDAVCKVAALETSFDEYACRNGPGGECNEPTCPACSDHVPPAAEWIELRRRPVGDWEAIKRTRQDGAHAVEVKREDGIRIALDPAETTAPEYRSREADSESRTDGSPGAAPGPSTAEDRDET